MQTTVVECEYTVLIQDSGSNRRPLKGDSGGKESLKFFSQIFPEIPPNGQIGSL